MPVVPAPIQVSTSGTFDGNDGSWSSFSLRVGNPAQDVRVLPSTLIPESWVVFPAGCTQSEFSNCGQLRGNLYENDSSTTWTPIGGGVPYSLGVEGNLQITTQDGGYYGYDTLGLSTPDGAGIVLDHQVVGGIITPDFWIGNLGLAARTSDVDNQNQTSFLKTLQLDNKIPSLSYGYTAGAWYRNATFGSLTLGGQDLSRFVPNSVNFTMAETSSRDLTVGLQSISLVDGGKQSSLLTDGILTFVDSTLPSIWLPLSACNAFADAFGLQFQELSLLYTVNASTHAKNLKDNASLVFQLGNSVQGGDTVNITFPYAAFDLNYTDPSVSNPQPVSYFPLRQAAEPNQYTLGRTFLQEAYLSVNYEFQNFSLAQTVPVVGNPQPHIIPIPSINSPTSNTGSNNPTGTSGPSGPSATAITVTQSSSSGISSGAIAGIVVAILLAAVAILGFLFCRRRRNKKRQQAEAEQAVAPPHMPELEQVEPTGTSYFALPTKAESSAYAGNKQAPSIVTESEAQEMPSPPIDQLGSYGSTGIVGDAANPNHPNRLNLPAVELAASDAGASHELPSPPESVGFGSRMSQGPSPSLNPQAPGSLAPSDAYDIWPTTHFEPASPTGLSVLSANSLTLTAAGPASLVSHTVGRSSPRAGSYTRSPPLSPLHSAGPSVDNTAIASSSAPNVNFSERSTGPSFDAPSVAAAITAAAASVGHGHVGGVAPATRDESFGALSHPGSRQRAASTRSQASEGTLVNPYSRSNSPEVGRHNAATFGSISSANGGSSVTSDSHPEISFQSPVLVGLGFAGEREREREAAREAETDAARREAEAGPRDVDVEEGRLEYAYRAAARTEPLDAAELSARRRQEASQRMGR